MTVDEIQTFVENNLYGDVPTETYNQIMTDAESMDGYSFNEKWGKFLNENSDGWVTMKKDFKPLSERLSKAFGSSDKENPFKRSKNELDEIYEKEFSDDVPRDMFDQALSKQSNYWEDFKNEREKEAGEIRRENEVKNWGLMRNALASDYEKQRYIKDPSAALFGDEATPISKDWLGKGEAISDLAYGAAGAVGDAIPGAGGIWVGPAVRGMRDVQHKQTNSDYQKDWSDIGKDITKDALLNVGTDVLPTALTRYGPRVAKFASRGKLGEGSLSTMMKESNELNKSKALVNEMNSELDKFGWNPRTNNWNPEKIKEMTDPEIWNAVKKLPNESPLKKQLMEDALIESNAGGRYIDKKKANEILFDYSISTPAKAEDANFQRFLVRPDGTYDNRVLLSLGSNGEKPWLQEYMLGLNDANQISKGGRRLNKGLDIWTNYGDKVAKELATAGVAPELPLPVNVTKRSSSEIKSDESEKNWFKNNYTRDWLLGFKPDKKDQKSNSPKWQAYKEWYYDQYGTMPQED